MKKYPLQTNNLTIVNLLLLRKMKSIFLIKLIALFCLSSCSSNDEAYFDDRIVMASNNEVSAYAIPNIVTTQKGTVLCLATARYGDNHDWGNVQKIALTRSFDNGATWEKPWIIAEIDNWTVRQTSVVVVPQTNKVIVFGHKSPRFTNKGDRISESWNIANPEERKNIGAAQFTIESKDDGETWSEIKEIDLPYWPHDPGISLKYGKYNGRLVIPARTNKGTVFDWNNLFNGVLISDDFGETWRGGGLTQSHVGEASVVELSDGRVYVNNRNHSENFGIRNHAISSDGGETFSEFGDDPQLIEPTCDAGMARFTDPGNDNIILFSNPAVKATKRWDGESRRRMSVKASFDDCKTWPINKLIYLGPTAYSGIAVYEDLIYLAYERAGLDSKDSRENIAVARFNKTWIELPEIEPPTIETSQRIFNKNLSIKFKTNSNYEIRYTLDNTTPTLESPLYKEPIVINDDVILKAITISGSNKSIVTEARCSKSELDKPHYLNSYSDKYPGNGDLALVDRITGGLNFDDGRWQGFEKKDFEVIVDLHEIKKLKSVTINFLQAPDFWIFFPKSVTFKISNDNKLFNNTKTIKNNHPLKTTDASIQSFEVSFENIPGRFIKIKAENIGTCPLWHKGSGGNAWLFTDEIIVN